MVWVPGRSSVIRFEPGILTRIQDPGKFTGRLRWNFPCLLWCLMFPKDSPVASSRKLHFWNESMITCRGLASSSYCSTLFKDITISQIFIRISHPFTKNERDEHFGRKTQLRRSLGSWESVACVTWEIVKNKECGKMWETQCHQQLPSMGFIPFYSRKNGWLTLGRWRHDIP